MLRIALAVMLTILLLPSAAVHAADVSPDDETEREALAGGAWHAGRFVACSDGVVTGVHPRLEEPLVHGKPAFESGVVVEMKLPASPRFFNGQAFPTAIVVHYQDERGNALMQSETPGTHVQVCLAGFPTPSSEADTGKPICDPNSDPRGFIFRVYDYHRHAAFMGPDSQHSCGGA
jgi:hypothetical protein